MARKNGGGMRVPIGEKMSFVSAPEQTMRPFRAGAGSHPVSQHQAGGERMQHRTPRIAEMTPEDGEPPCNSHGGPKYR